MDYEGSAYTLLECILLDESAEPKDLPLSLLKFITNNFSDDQEIGSGGFSTVYKGILQNGTIAVKKLSQAVDMDEKNFNQEVTNLIRVKHKNIVRFLGYCADTQGKVEKYQGMVVMADVRQRLLCFEFLPNGGLDGYISDASQGLEWRTRYQIIKGICEGLDYLHQKKMVHLDLKPANILLNSNMVPKIADFGLSRCFDEKQSRTITSKLVGSLGYLAPEFFSGVITLKSDIYSLGVVIIEILTGQKGYPAVENLLDSWSNRFQKSQGDKNHLEQVRVCTEIGIECIESNPAKRPTTQRIMEALNEMESRYGFDGTGDATPSATSISEKDAPNYSQISGGEPTQSRYLPPSTPASMLPVTSTEVSAFSSMKYALQRVLKKKMSTEVFFYKTSKKRQDYFEQHGGQMLLQILETDGNNIAFTLYDRKDLVKATRGFHKDNVVGEGAHGTVYKATLGGAASDASPNTVAVKRCKQIDETRTKEFVQELIVLCRVSHPNIVRLLGWCLHFKAPMFVYEFVPNGTLSDLLHGGPRRRVTLPTRLRIAAETAEALAHLHSPPHPTLHGDVKPQNILLGKGYVAKVFHFGFSTINDNVQVVPKGTLAYLDPEFLLDCQITEKTDVYSFGIVLIELLTRKNPQAKEWKNLTTMFQDRMGNGTLGDLLDADIVEEGSVELIYEAAKLVSQCIATPGNARPPMPQVAAELRRFSDHGMPESHEARAALEFEDDGRYS